MVQHCPWCWAYDGEHSRHGPSVLRLKVLGETQKREPRALEENNELPGHEGTQAMRENFQEREGVG